MTFNKNFNPWRKDALKACIWLGVLAFLGFLFVRNPSADLRLLLGLMTLAGCMAAYYLRNASRRRFGQTLERRASDSLEKVFGQENVKRNLPLPGAGDLDAAIQWRSVQYNVEIKSMGSLEKVTDKHIEQARKGARYFKTKPIVWLPNSQSTRKKMVGEVLIFQGSAKALRSYITPFFGFRRF